LGPLYVRAQYYLGVVTNRVPTVIIFNYTRAYAQDYTLFKNNIIDNFFSQHLSTTC